MMIVSYPAILTPLDGTTVRWFASEKAADAGVAEITANRRGVFANGKLDLDLVTAAFSVHERLKDSSDPGSLVTHTRGLIGSRFWPAP